MLKYSWKCAVRMNFFTKTCVTYNYFSPDPHFVILAFVQNRSISEKSMKVCSPPEFFHKNELEQGQRICPYWNVSLIEMSHEQLPFTWSTFCDSSLGTKLKYLWKTHETVNLAKNFSQKHVSPTISSHVLHISSF